MPQWKSRRMTRGCAFSAIRLISPFGVIASVMTGRMLGADSVGALGTRTACVSACVMRKRRSVSAALCRMAAFSRASAAAAARQARARREQAALSAMQARIGDRRGRMAGSFRHSPRLMMLSRAPGISGSTMCGAVPSKMSSPACGTATPSRLSGSPEQKYRVEGSPLAQSAACTRRMNVDLPTPGPPLRISLRRSSASSIRWSKQEIKPSGPIAPGKRVLAVVKSIPPIWQISLHLMPEGRKNTPPAHQRET